MKRDKKGRAVDKTLIQFSYANCRNTRLRGKAQSHDGSGDQSRNERGQNPFFSLKLCKKVKRCEGGKGGVSHQFEMTALLAGNPKDQLV